MALQKQSSSKSIGLDMKEVPVCEILGQGNQAEKEQKASLFRTGLGSAHAGSQTLRTFGT